MYMRTAFKIFLSLVVLLLSASCVREEDYITDDTPEGNFEALWKILDENYCFFDYKQKEYGLDWNEVYTRYQSRIRSKMTDEQLFEVLNEMLRELRDGHTNLYAKHDVGRYWDWFESYPANFSDSIQRNYLGTDYRISSTIRYKILDDNVGYMYIPNFSTEPGDGNLNQVIKYLQTCNGLIVDVRNNGGGLLSAAEKVAQRFTEEKVLVGYIQHKSGTGHNDFSTPVAQYVEPSDGIRWQKKVCVLTNRQSYSSTNDFVGIMKAFSNVTLVGDRTGGGSGLPMSLELPNGWSVRFSSSPMYDADMQCNEFGIDPDVKVDITSEDYNRGVDTIIETARKLLNNEE
jgi:hypothetical protein